MHVCSVNPGGTGIFEPQPANAPNWPRPLRFYGERDNENATRNAANERPPVRHRIPSTKGNPAMLRQQRELSAAGE
jgi:hypothetical protein